MRSLTLAAALLAVTSLAPLAAAQITVGPAGSGFQFTEIQDAIDFAPPNSIILVYPGDYSKPLYIDKSLTIIGDTINAWTPTMLQSAGTAPTAMVEITGIDSLEEVRITGLRFKENPISTHALYIHDCEGRVVVNDIESAPQVGPFFTGPVKAGVVVHDSDAVVGDKWDFVRVLLSNQAISSFSVTLDIQRSSLWLSNSLLASPGNTPFLSPGQSPAGIRAVDSHLSLSNCNIGGGAGGIGGDIPFFIVYAKAGPAINAKGSTLRVAGGPLNVLKAGFGTSNENGNSAVILEGASSLDRAADVSIVPTQIGFTGPAIAMLGGSTTITRPHRWPNIELSAQRVSPGLSATMNTRGNPLSLHLLFYATQMQLPFDEPLLQGPIILDIGAVIQLAEFATDASGNGSFGFALPPIPQLIGFGVHFQTLELGAAGAFISNAALLTITNVN